MARERMTALYLQSVRVRVRVRVRVGAGEDDRAVPDGYIDGWERMTALYLQSVSPWGDNYVSWPMGLTT